MTLESKMGQGAGHLEGREGTALVKSSKYNRNHFRVQTPDTYINRGKAWAQVICIIVLKEAGYHRYLLSKAT